MPTGQKNSPISRIRGTINMYTTKLSTLKWLQNFKIQTIQALCRRLTAHTPMIIGGSNVELEIAFRQLRQRGGSLGNFFK